MAIYYLVMDLTFESEPPDSVEAFDALTGRVLDELAMLEEVDSGVVDPDITAGLVERRLSVLMGVEADSRRDALRLFLANVRTALHAAGCGTPGWPKVPSSLPTPREPDHAPA